jgi:hypothetical protein
LSLSSRGSVTDGGRSFSWNGFRDIRHADWDAC